MLERVDLIIRPGAILTMVDDTVMYDAMIAVQGARIVYVGDRQTGESLYEGDRVIDDPEAVVLPGFVDTHTHLGAHFFGTLIDEENVITAVYDLWFPMEFAWDHETMYAASCLGIWDALRSGVTTVANDQYVPQATAEAVDELGLRALVSREINEFAAPVPVLYDKAARKYSIAFDRRRAEAGLAENIALIEHWQGHPRVTPCLGPHAPDLLSGEMLQRIASEAEKYDVKMLMHIAQSQAEVEQVRERGAAGSIHYLDSLGILSPRLQGAHMVWIDDDEIALAVASGMGMSWTPTIMMACQSYARIDAVLGAGLRVGFGTDCFSFDVLEELRYAIYSANFVRGLESGFRLRAYDLIRMATIGGAACLGLDDSIGTVEAGKLADLAVVNLDDCQLIPNTNYFETLVYRAKARNVTHTIVGGEVVYEAGHLCRADESELVERGRTLASEWVGRSREVLARANTLPRIQPHFPLPEHATDANAAVASK
ncbi:MAG: amidohydrolase family protein [Solirubrobacteraceae bacterium]